MSSNQPPSMFELIDQLPDQLAGSRSLLERAGLPRLETPRRILVCGMGGSAAAGTLVRGIYEQQVEVLVARRYAPPIPWTRDSFLVFSSYSGDTEETLSAYDQLRQRAPSAPRVVISSGGSLVRRAVEDGVPVLRLPPGLPPRASLGWGLGGLVRLLGHLGLVEHAERELESAVERLRRGVDRWTSGGEDDRLQRLAERLAGRLPVLYAADGMPGAVAERWRAQLNENSKCLVSTALLPELDHNEVVGWDQRTDARGAAFVLALRDEEDHPRVQRRFEVTRDVLGDRVADWVELRAEPGDRLARAMDLVQQGDYLSAHLAAAHDVDPTPVRRIDELKARLGDDS